MALKSSQHFNDKVNYMFIELKTEYKKTAMLY